MKAFIGVLARRGELEPATETYRRVDEAGHTVWDEDDQPVLGEREVRRRVRANDREKAVRSLRQRTPDGMKVFKIGREGEEPTLVTGAS